MYFNDFTFQQWENRLSQDSASNSNDGEVVATMLSDKVKYQQGLAGATKPPNHQ